MTEKEILEGATDDQIEAIKNYEGPCFILAGPGSGKTFTIISRAQYMIKKGVDPSSIMMFTFTCKAANEIKDRIKTAIGQDGERIMAGTYHSICSKILRKYADRMGYTKKFSIYDTEDVKNSLKDIIDSKDIDIYSVISYISGKKNKMISPKIAMRAAESNLDTTMASYYSKYQNNLKKNNAMDFDDLIGNAIELLENNPDVLSKINKKYKYIIADESHDSAPRDLKLIKLLAGKDENICFIADEEQS